jgi:hypothetical protein
LSLYFFFLILDNFFFNNVLGFFFCIESHVVEWFFKALNVNLEAS